MSSFVTLSLIACLLAGCSEDSSKQDDGLADSARPNSELVEIVEVEWRINSIVEADGNVIDYTERSYNFVLSRTVNAVSGTLYSCLGFSNFDAIGRSIQFLESLGLPPPCPLPAIDLDSYADVDAIVENDNKLGNALRDNSFIFSSDGAILELIRDDGLSMFASIVR